MILEKITSELTDSITINKKPRKIRGNLAQTAILEYLLGKRYLYKDNGELLYGGYIKVYYNKQAMNRLDLSKEFFIQKLQEEKHFIIDFSLYNLHTKRGKVGLKLQLAHSLVEIRNILYDTNLWVVAPQDFDISFLGRNEIQIKTRDQLINTLTPDNAIILDPFAEKTLIYDDIKNYKYFLIGGLVDLEVEWIDATKYLYSYLIEKGIETRKITLFGDIAGVPDRINSIIKIILEAYYKRRNIQDVIIDEMSRRDIYRFITKRFKTIEKEPSILLPIFQKYPNIVSEILRKYKKEQILDFLRQSIEK